MVAGVGGCRRVRGKDCVRLRNTDRRGCGLFLGLSSGPRALEGDAVTSLPERPDLNQLRRQAKELREGARSGDAAALERFAAWARPGAQGPVSLAAAQLVIARELGFPSWPKLKAAVDADAAVRASVGENLRTSA